MGNQSSNSRRFRNVMLTAKLVLSLLALAGNVQASPIPMEHETIEREGKTLGLKETGRCDFNTRLLQNGFCQYEGGCLQGYLPSYSFRTKNKSCLCKCCGTKGCGPEKKTSVPTHGYGGWRSGGYGYQYTGTL